MMMHGLANVKGRSLFKCVILFFTWHNWW